MPNRAWSLHRNRLSALTSVNGCYGFTNGVEWLATEQVNVHSSRGLAWGSADNLLKELGALNRLLADHPCFFDGAKLTRLSPDGSAVYLLRRDSAEGTDAVLVLVNTDCEQAKTFRLETRLWSEFCGPGHFPDADMLPLGVIAQGKRSTNFTHDEQYTLMTLWSIVRSPLIFGGDLTKIDDFTLSLITNDEVLAVDQSSSGNHPLFNRDGWITWIADVPGTADKYLAVFNTKDASAGSANQKINIPFTELGLAGQCAVRDLWQKKDLGSFEDAISIKVAAHGAVLYRVSPK